MKKTGIDLTNLYQEQAEWKQNLGEETVHAKRVDGKYRTLKYILMLVWLPFFILPYVKWNEKQAILFDVNNGQYHIFDLTVYPEDLWLMVVVMLLLAGMLAAMTTLIGRAFCGYFCFQTVWTDIFTKIEEKIEGPAIIRMKQDGGKLTKELIIKKIYKHTIWLGISIFTGITWMLYFGVEWADYFNWSLSESTLVITAIISGGAYLFAGFMREQTCLWLCPYARIQGVMVGKSTKLPTYDYHRGEPRGKIKKGEETGNGDCISCGQCQAVCPTGVDIRKGQEYGCITCGLCIDVCDTIMEKTGKKKGLIRYMSLNELNGEKNKSLFKKKRIWIYVVFMIPIVWSINFGISNSKEINVTVIQDRQPLYVTLSDGKYRNKYEVKIKNKGTEIKKIELGVISKALKMDQGNGGIVILPGTTRIRYIYLIGTGELNNNKTKLTIKDKTGIIDEKELKFFTPN